MATLRQQSDITQAAKAMVGQEVADRDGTPIGVLNHVYLGRESGRPTWGLVQDTDGNERFVPLERATQHDDGLSVPVSVEQVRTSPALPPAPDLGPDTEASLRRHYAARHNPNRLDAAGNEHSALAVRRSRGAVSAVLLILLGAWGALVPFVGPYFGYAFGSGQPWVFTLDRLWLSVLPGLAVVLGGILLGPSANRVAGGLGAWLALLGGIWYVAGPVLGQLWGTTGPGAPIGEPVGGTWLQVLAQLGYFYGLGALITALAAFALGRLTVRSVKD